MKNNMRLSRWKDKDTLGSSQIPGSCKNVFEKYSQVVKFKIF